MKNRSFFFIFFAMFSLSSIVVIPFTDLISPTNFNWLNSIIRPKNKNYSTISESTNSIDPKGSGSNLIGEEYPFNSSSKQGVINGNSINMVVPTSYSGKSFWVKIENLTANRTTNSFETADNDNIKEGTLANGNYTDTNTLGGGYYQVNDGPGIAGIDVDLEFNINGIAQQDVTSIYWYVLGQRQRNVFGGQNVGIRMWNATSSSFINIGTVSSTGGYASYSGTINGNDCFANASPQVTLNFLSSNSTGNFIRLDYVFVRVYYTKNFDSVLPEDINFRVQHGVTSYYITSANGNSTKIEGNSVGPTTEIFTFQSDDPSNFDIEYTLQLNKSKNADSYYFLADTENLKNTWKVNYSVDSIPSGYDKLNFTVQLPKNWEYLNTTAPNGNDHSAYTTTDNSGLKLLVSIDSDAVDLFRSQLPLNWSIFANSSNYISQLQFFQYPNYATPLSSPIIYNITDNMTIKCPLIGYTSSPSSANLTIFNSSNYVVHQELAVDVTGSSIIFSDWNISKFNVNGQYLAQVTWFNGTQIGFRNASFSVIYPTMIEMVSPEKNLFDWGGNRTLEVTVRYLNTFTKTGVSGANVANYTWDGGASTALNDLSNGEYNLSEADTNKIVGNYYQLNISIQKFGYHNITNYLIKVRIVNDTELTITIENESHSLVNPNMITSYYPESLNITANYTQLWVAVPNPLENAIINVTIDGNYYTDMIPKSGKPGIYYLILNSSEFIQTPLDIDQYTVEISAWKDGYYPYIRTFIWDIYETPSNITPTPTNYSGYGGTPFTIRIYYNDTYHNYLFNITDANFTITYGPSQSLYNLHSDNITNYLNGTYDIDLIFNIYNINDNFQLNITANRSGYQPKSVLIDLSIWVYNTSIVYLTFPSEIPLYENQTIQIGFNRTDFGDGVLPTIEVAINQTYGVIWQNITDSGNYTITLITQKSISNINASLQYVNLTINKTNYEVRFIPIYFNIRENRTIANLSDCVENWYFLKFDDRGNYYHLDIHLNRTVDLLVNYTNNETGIRYNIKNETQDPVNISVKLYNATNGNYIGEFNASQYGMNQFNLTIITSAYALPVGKYFLNISFKKFNHKNSFIYVNLSIIPWESFLVPWEQTQQLLTLTQWQYQSINFSVNFTKIVYNASAPRSGIIDAIDNSPSWDAKVNFTINDLLNHTVKTGWYLTYNDVSKLWEISGQVPLSSDTSAAIPPGNYKVWINSSAKDIASMRVSFYLSILDHLPASIFILTPPTVSEGGTLFLQINFKINGTDYGDTNMEKSLIFHLILISDGGILPLDIPLETDYHGTSTFGPLPVAGLKSIIYWAEFAGLNTSWPLWSIKSSVSIPMGTEVTSIWTFLIPIIIAAGIAAIVIPTVYVLNRRVRVKHQTKVMEEAEKTFDYFNDLISIRKVYLIHKKDNECIFEQNYNMVDFEEFTDKALISMIKGFGKGKSGYNASLDLVRFQDFVIIIDDGDFVRTAFVMNKLPSRKFLKGIVRFVQIFEINNFNLLKEDGKFANWDEVHDLLDYIFEISIILPYRVTMKGMNMKLNAFRSQLVMMAYESQTDGYFFISNLYNKILSDSMMPELMVFKEISFLINKRAFTVYSIKKLKEEGKTIKYVTPKKVESVKKEEKFKALPKIEEEPEEEYITPVTAQIVEDYEMPQPTHPLTESLETTEAIKTEIMEEEIEAESSEKTPFEMMLEKEFKKPEVEEKKPTKPAKIEEVERLPKGSEKVSKPGLVKPAIIEPVKIKPVISKPVTPKITPKPKPAPTISKRISTKLIIVSEADKKQLDKSVIQTLNEINKLISAMDNLENFVGKSVRSMVNSQKIVDITSSNIEKTLKNPKLILEKEVINSKKKANEVAQLVEKLLLTLNDIEKEIEKCDKEFEKISKGVKKIEKNLNKQPKDNVKLDLEKLDYIREKLIAIDEKLGKSLEIREKFEDKINESARKVENIDDLLKNAEKKVVSAKEKMKVFKKDIDTDLQVLKRIKEKKEQSKKDITEYEQKENKLIEFIKKSEEKLKILKGKTETAEFEIKNTFVKKVKEGKGKTDSLTKKPLIPKVTLEKPESIPPPFILEDKSEKTTKKPIVPEKNVEKTLSIPKPVFPEEIEEKKDDVKKIKEPMNKESTSAKIYEIQAHCPVCSKIIEGRELILLKKGFSPECPACGTILKPKDFDL
ncbi:MAG: hypothetical protein ACTSRG_04660 [Candidatus Helarchaeota archaeon]